MFFIEIFIISIIIILFLFQRISIRIIYKKETEIKIYFLFFTLRFYPQRKIKNNFKKKVKRTKNLIKNRQKVKNYLNRFLKKTNITLYALNTKIKEDRPDETAIKAENRKIFLSVIFSFLLEKVNKITSFDRTYIIPKNSDIPSFDISLDFTLFNLIFSLLSYKKERSVIE